MSVSRILIPILIVLLVFGLLSTINGDPYNNLLKGTLTSKQDGKPIAGAIIEIGGTNFKANTAADGKFTIAEIPQGAYTINIRAAGFIETNIIRCELVSGKVTVIDYALTAVTAGSPGIEAVFASEIQKFEAMGAMLIGTVTDAKTNQPLPGVAIQLEGTTIGGISDVNGNYQILNIPPQSYTVKIRLVGYQTRLIKDVQITSDKVSRVDGSLDETVLEGEEIVVCAKIDHVKLNETQCLRSGALQYVPGQSSDNFSSGRWLPHGGTTPPNGDPYSGTFFKHYGVNPFIDTEDDHFSTFAIDVDDASYSVARAYIERGNLPDPAAVRTEEFINFFNYDYPAPENETFRVYIEGAPSEFGQNCSLLRIGIKGQEINPKDRKPAVLTFVIDISGSMGIDSRLGTVKQALRILVDNLRDDDLVGIAVYGSRGMKYMDHTSVKNKNEILYKIDQLGPEGSTNAEEGLTIGYQMASDNFKEGAINRIILCSDGVANVGVTGAEGILEKIKQYVDKGITLTTVGFGMDNYNDILMEKLGDKGNGHFAYVDNLEQAKRIFLQNLTGTLQVIARDVKIQVDFDPAKVRSYRLLGYENRDVADDKFRDDKEDGGEIGSGHDVTALYEVKFKDNASGQFATVYIRHKDPDHQAEVTERNFPLNMNDIKSDFAKTSSSFRLAACAAEFAEILRESHWAKDGDLGKVLALAQELSIENKGDDDLIEFAAMVSRAKKLWDEKELHSEGN